MGKAQIMSGGADGLYTIKLLFDRTKVAAQITLMNRDVETVTDRITALETEIVDWERRLYIALHTESPLPSFSTLMGIRAQITERQFKRAMLILYKESLLKRIAFLQNPAIIPPDADVPAWCADLTENLTGFVGTIEPNGEPANDKYIIQPGHNSNAVYNRARDGQVQAAMGSSPAVTFFNKALMPGWQKWNPTFRIGVISAIDRETDTCSITLDAVNSREKPRRLININQETEVSDVPITYMH